MGHWWWYHHVSLLQMAYQMCAPLISSWLLLCDAYRTDQIFWKHVCCITEHWNAIIKCVNGVSVIWVTTTQWAVSDVIELWLFLVTEFSSAFIVSILLLRSQRHFLLASCIWSITQNKYPMIPLIATKPHVYEYKSVFYLHSPRKHYGNDTYVQHYHDIN